MPEIKHITPRYENLTRIAKERKCNSFLEIGTWAGITAQNLILTAQQYAEKDEIVYHGIDLFELLTPEIKKAERAKSPQKYEEIKAKLKALGSGIFLYKGFSREILTAFDGAYASIKFDLIYIDGGHRAETIAQDWKDVQRFIGPHTVVVFDDYRQGNPQIGCKELVDSLQPGIWNVEILGPTEKFPECSVNFAQVTPGVHHGGI